MQILVFYQRTIAEQLGFSQSAISQELARNSVDGIYNPEKAQELANSRKIQRNKPVLGDLEIQEFIKEELKKRRSPEQANNREEFGHLEIDFVIGCSGSRACVLSGRERKTRYPFLIKLENKTELLTTEAIKNNLIASWTKSFSIDNDKSFVGHSAIKALTGVPTYFTSFSTDNDKSFVGHSAIKALTGVPTYFTRPSAPYEKGAIEQLNKELRVYHPKGTNFTNVTQAELDQIAENLRTAPMVTTRLLK